MPDQSAPPEYQSWQDAARGGNLLSYIQGHTMNALVPGYDPNEPGYLKALDIASLPARAAVNALLGPVTTGGKALDAWMHGQQGAPTKDLITKAVLGILGQGLEGAKPGVGRPPEARVLPPPGYQLIPVDHDPFA